jgi:hypothetical protein
VEAGDRLSVRVLNAALRDELMPAGRDGRTVLLDCDDEALAAAVARLPDAGDPETVLREVLHSVAPITSERGLRGVLRELKGPPDDLIILCACVLAASRMHSDERHHTSAYYARLCDLLGILPRDQHPAVAGFEAIPARFAALAEWAAREGRGRVMIPAHPSPSLVGVAISQTLLRRVDRDRLGTFFDRHRRQFDLGRDPLRLLRASVIRHQLTDPAQRLLYDEEFAEPLRAALETDYQAWDGTVLDDRGRRVVVGRLRLGLSPGRVTLNLSLPRSTVDTEIRGPDHETVHLPPPPREAMLPLSWLDCAVVGSVTASAADGHLVRVLPGPTMLFEVADSGFWLTAAAAEGEPVILLSCDPELVQRDWGRRRVHAPLPTGWVLICDVESGDLPEELRRAADEDQYEASAAVELFGGLPLELGVWMIDHPPALRSLLDEPVVIEAHGREEDWREIGELRPEEDFTLDAIAHRLGTQHVAVAGHEFSFELAERGLREKVGELGHRPRHEHLMRAGAISSGDARRYGDPRPVVCGATVDSAGLVGWRAPVTVRAQAPVHVIYGDGSVVVATPQPQPQWARQAQLPPGGSWAIPNGHDAVWLCVQSKSHPRVIALKADPVPLTDEVVDVVQWFDEMFAGAPVIERDAGNAEARWRELVHATAFGTEEELPSHG